MCVESPASFENVKEGVLQGSHILTWRGGSRFCCGGSQAAGGLISPRQDEDLGNELRVT
jgi:hypothetical protein